MFFLSGNVHILWCRWLYTFVNSGVIYTVEMFIWNGLRCTETQLLHDSKVTHCWELMDIIINFLSVKLTDFNVGSN